MHDRDAVIEAIRRSWSRDTCEQPGIWGGSNPPLGHCDVSSFVAWEHLGGELVLGEVHLDGEFQEHHYWNRIDGVDVDLTVGQFKRGERVTEAKVLSAAFISANREAMRPSLLHRVTMFREEVDRQLAKA